MARAIEIKNGYGIHAKPEHFDNAFDLCVNNRFTRQQAYIMMNGFDKLGLQDASAGCMHYILRYTFNI